MFIRSHRGNRRPVVAPASVQAEAPVEEKVSEPIKASEIIVAEEAKESVLEEEPKAVERRTRRKREGK